MKPKGKREYVKSKGEFVLLSVYIKKMQKKMKIKGGYGYFNEHGIYTYKKTPINKKVENKLKDVQSYVKGLRGTTVEEYKPDSNLYTQKPFNFYEQQQLDKDIDDDLNKRTENESNINANKRGLRHRKRVSKIMNFFSKNPTSTPPSNNKEFTARADLVFAANKKCRVSVKAYLSKLVLYRYWNI